VSGLLPDAEPSAPARPAAARFARGIENGLLAGALFVMMALPAAEMVLRKAFHTGLAGSTTIVQHLVLVVAMLGGAAAARDDRLLALSTLTYYAKGRWAAAGRALSYGAGALVSLFLCLAAWQYVQAMRPLGKELALGIPVWAVQLVMPAGFGLIALRLVWRAGSSWLVRALVAGLAAAAAVALARFAPEDPSGLRWPLLAALLGLTALGAPIFAAIGGAALILLWTQGEPIASIPLNHYSLTTNPTLPAIPLFTLAGYFLAQGGASRRLVRLFQAWFGWFRGGPAVATVLVCAFFTSFTGASGVTILALGGLLFPVLTAAGYAEATALGLLTAAGSLGLLFPPCLPPILYSIVAGGTAETSVRMEEMFQGGLLPGLLMMAMVCLYGVWKAPPTEGRPRFRLGEAWGAFWEAKWELLIPAVALGALFGGFATPVEAAALTAAYASFVEVVVYRDVHPWREAPAAAVECGKLVGGVLLILGVALGFTYFLIDVGAPDAAVAWATRSVHSRVAFLLAVNLLLLVVGCLMDIYSAIVVVTPLLAPVARAFGIDMVHLGVIFLTNLELGYLTPPVGMNLFLASYRFEKSMPTIIRAVLPLLGVMAVGVLVVTYVPALTTFLPRLLRGGGP